MSESDATSHPVFQAIRSRRTAHTFRSEPVPEDCMVRALDAANHAPCHRLTFPWRFLRVGARTRSALAEVAVAIKAAKHPLTEVEVRKAAGKILDPPELLVACQVRVADPFQAREDYAACSCAIQNLCVSLAGDGVASKWSTGGLTRDPRTWRILGVDPGLLDVVGFVWVGYADAPGPISRPPLDAVVATLP